MFWKGGLGAVQQAVLPAGSGVRRELGRTVGQGEEVRCSLEGWEDLVAG